ncbi:MAG: hypothetical protein SLRJCFUN_002052, partial [Candidatus Fervidibacter sp.]
ARRCAETYLKMREEMDYPLLKTTIANAHA